MFFTVTISITNKKQEKNVPIEWDSSKIIARKDLLIWRSTLVVPLLEQEKSADLLTFTKHSKSISPKFLHWSGSED